MQKGCNFPQKDCTWLCTVQDILSVVFHELWSKVLPHECKKMPWAGDSLRHHPCHSLTRLPLRLYRWRKTIRSNEKHYKGIKSYKINKYIPWMDMGLAWNIMIVENHGSTHWGSSVNRFSISCAKPWAFRYDVPAWCSTGSCGCMAIAAIGTDQHFSALHGGGSPDVRKISKTCLGHAGSGDAWICLGAGWCFVSVCGLVASWSRVLCFVHLCS